MGMRYRNNNKITTIHSQDLSDATATANDIVQGKTAYIADGKVTGNYIDKLQWKCDNVKSLKYEFDGYTGTDLSILDGLDTSQVTNISNMFNNCSNVTTIPSFNTSNVKDASNLFSYCYKLKRLPINDIGNVTNMQYMCYGCRELENIPYLDTSNVSNITYAFQDCRKLTVIPSLNILKTKTLSGLFTGCTALETIGELNLLNITGVYETFTSCRALKNLTLKNIKLSLQIGSGTSWGHLLTNASLLNTAKELWDNTNNALGGARTLTMSTTSKTNIQSIYVKLITPTAEQEAEDPYINNKKPCVECTSTDEGAMTLEEYIISKNWSIA